MFVVGVGVFVSWGTQRFFMKVLLEPKKTVQKAFEEVKRLEEEQTKVKVDSDTKLPLGHLGTKLQGWVGAIEIILYASSVVFEHPEFIAVWFATKYVSGYRTWAKEPVGRTMYNRSLFGSGLNILLGFFTGRVALWAIFYFGPH